MNIVVLGSGAIGSLFGYFLSKENNVVLIGRKNHVNEIKQSGLNIKGETNANVKLSAFEKVEDVKFIPDLLILAVKSYDTENSIRQAEKIIDENTFVMSLQNGLDNVDKIEKYVPRKNISICITTHGVVFSKPGFIQHTGVGKTVVGTLENNNNQFIKKIAKMLNKSGVKTTISKNIIEDIWVKAIVNSSINPLTAIFNCKNGYLLENPVLEKIVEKICMESTNIANSCKINVSYDDMIKKTKEVISDTSNNYSSMHQSFNYGKKTEIDSINKIFVQKAEENNVDCMLNKIIVDFF